MIKTLGITSSTVANSTATLTSDNTNVTDGKVVRIGDVTYTWKTTLTPTEGQVHIGGSADASLLNLIRAVNHSGTPGTDYSVAVANPKASAATSVTSHAVLFTAKIKGSDGNSIVTTTDDPHLSWPGGTMNGGENVSVAIEIDDTATYSGIPRQQITIENYPAGNPAFSRFIKVTDEAIFIGRFGANTVAFDITQLVENLAILAEPTLSYVPRITLQPASVTVTSGDNATFTTGYLTETTATVQWQSSDDGDVWEQLSDAGFYSGTSTSTLSITAAEGSLGGKQYRAVIQNNSGISTTSAATLSVGIAITAQPVDDEQTAPTASGFDVTADGQATLTYQWQLATDGGTVWANLSNGTPYSGVTTASLVIDPTAGGLSGYKYRCIVTNSIGSVTSNAAELIVT